jgi:hypothetical protein
MMRMLAEGIDPTVPGALDAWMADFNGRPREERDAIVGAAADRMAGAAGLPPAGGSRAVRRSRNRRRKAQRSARKRNRSR